MNSHETATWFARAKKQINALSQFFWGVVLFFFISLFNFDQRKIKVEEKLLSGSLKDKAGKETMNQH